MDIRLISLIPPSQAVTQVSGVPATTTQGAPIVPQLPAGSVLAGFIVNRDAAGNPILRTQQGDFTFSSNFFLKIGSEVVIRIQQSGGQSNAHIVNVNGQPPEVAAQQSSFADEPDVILGQKQPPPQQTAGQSQAAPPAPSTLPAPKAGQTVSAIVVTPATPAAASSAASPVPGTSFLLSVLNVNPPQVQTLATAASPLEQLVPAARTVPVGNALSTLLPATTTGQSATPAAQLPPLAAQIPIPAAQTAPVAASNQQAAMAQLPPGPLGQTFVATVATVNDDGSITLNTPLGILRVAEAGGPPPGQQLTLRVTSVASPNNYTIAMANSAAASPAAPLTELARAWTSLQQIAQALGEDAASRFIPTFPTGTHTPGEIPGRITQSASQVLFFIAALKGGDLRGWLGGHNVKTLEDKGYAPLIRKAEGEFLLMARQFAEPQPGNWQSAFIPVMAGGELQQLRAFVKREKKKNEQGSYTGEEDTRFVVEMELSQLGDMQMDGLVKRRDKSLQFDLIIRSHETLPKHVEQDIQAIYTSTAEATGYKGQLSFQAVHSFPLHPLEDTLPPTDDVIA